MGTTCASFHALWRGNVDDAAKAIGRAYTKIGYERVRKAPADGGRQVILLARAGEGYVSVFDSANADLDSGELKDAALAASKLLKTGAVVTSLYDSDSFEFVVFGNGRQIDLLMTDVDNYDGPLKRLVGKSRMTQWNRTFGSAATAEQIERAAAPGATVHLYNWVINHPDCLARLGTSLDEMTARLDALAAAAAPLQAWHGRAAWIPVFDRAESYESTAYEEMSALNVFRGIHHGLSFGLKDRRLTAQWCRHILRMVAPHLWLCPELMALLDRPAVERVAVVSESGGSTKLEKRPDCAMDDFELALLPILPIESTRLTIRPR